MNTNQLLFNTNLQQQQQYMQQTNTPSASSGGLLDLTAGSTSLPYATSSNVGANMFATGTPANNYGTGFGIGPNLGNQINVNVLGTPAVAAQQQVNPNYQLNAGFQTGALNINQLYQTNQMGGAGSQQQSIHELTSLSSQPQHQMGMFQTGVPTVPAGSGPAVGFSTTVPNNSIFDLI